MANDTKSLKYKVYISFHLGEDTIRYSFVSHLSASLRRKGLIPSASSFVDNCSNGTQTEKHNYKAFVVVFSEKYVLSSECLDELAEIVDGQRNNQNVVVPVFYTITQSEVMHKSRLDILRATVPLESNSAQRVDRWIGALKKTIESYKPR
ncbi:hypothetical protein Bca4012_009423 [Brassica carinata]